MALAFLLGQELPGAVAQGFVLVRHQGYATRPPEARLIDFALFKAVQQERSPFRTGKEETYGRFSHIPCE